MPKIDLKSGTDKAFLKRLNQTPGTQKALRVLAIRLPYVLPAPTNAAPSGPPQDNQFSDFVGRALNNAATE